MNKMILNKTKAEAKPWYTSKLVLLGVATILVFLVPQAQEFLIGQGVTPEQMLVLESQFPAIADAIKQLQNGASIFQVIGGIIGSLIVVLRAWFTSIPGITFTSKE